MEIKELGYYQTREGKRVRVICVDADKDRPLKYPIVAIDCHANVRIYRRDGVHSAGVVTQAQLDIVSKWVEKPVVRWDYMPAWANYVAQNAAEDWYWYREEPEMAEGVVYYLDDPTRTGLIPKEYAPTFGDHWRRSLAKRPDGEPRI